MILPDPECFVFSILIAPSPRFSVGCQSVTSACEATTSARTELGETPQILCEGGLAAPRPTRWRTSSQKFREI